MTAIQPNAFYCSKIYTVLKANASVFLPMFGKVSSCHALPQLQFATKKKKTKKNPGILGEFLICRLCLI